MGLRDVLKRLKKGAENTGGFLEDVALGGGSRGGFDVSDYYHGVGRLMENIGVSRPVLGGLEAAGMDAAIDKAKAYLQQHAPGVRSSLDFFDMNPSAADRAEYGRNPFANTQKTFEGFANIGQQAAGEPIAYGLNKIPAIGNDEVQVGGQTVGVGGPWSGLQRQALLQGGANAGGAADVAAKAGAAGINIATNPLTYAPVSNAPLLAQIGLGTLGVGGFGGASAPAQVARALAGGAGMAAGSDVAGRITGDNPLAELAGGFAGAILAHRAGAATPGLSGLFKDAEGTAVRRPDAVADSAPAASRTAPITAPDVTLPDTTVALHAGIPIPKGPAVGGLIGGTVGALWPADSLEERQKNAQKGFLIGAGAGAVPSAVRRLAPLGSKAVETVESLTNPSALANQGIRERFDAWRAGNDQWLLHAEKNLAPEARAQAEIVMAGATIKPDVADALRKQAASEASARAFQPEQQVPMTRTYVPKGQTDPVTVPVLDRNGNPRMKTVAAVSARDARPGVIDKMDATIGSFRDIMEHPEDYTFTPEAQAALEKSRSAYKAQLQREIDAGVWDDKRNEWNDEARQAIARRDRLIGNPAAGVVGEVDRVYARAQKAMAAISRPLLAQADRWDALAAKARANEAAARTRGGAIQGTMAAPIPRMDRVLARAALRADAAVQATEDWFTTQAESLAQRIESLSTSIDTARSAGVASGDAAIQTGKARAAAALDRFEASAARVAKPSQTGQFAATGNAPLIRQGSRLDGALDTLRTRIAAAAEREGAAAVDPILRDFDRLATQADTLYDRAAIVATADTPRTALYQLERLQKDLDAAGVQARQAVSDVRQRGVRATTLDADAFAAQARLAEMRAAQARATADKVQEPIARRAGQQMASMQRRAMIADARATAAAQRVQEPVQNYIYHILADEGQPLPFGRVRVGGEKGFQKERTYKDYRAMALDDVEALTDDAGLLLSRRVTSGMSAAGEQQLVQSLADEVRRPGGDVVPDFMAGALDAQHGAGYVKDNFKPLDGILVNLKSTKDAQRQLAHQLLGTANLPPGLSQQEMTALRAHINRGDVRFLVRNETADYLNNVLGRGGWSENPMAQTVDQVTGTLRAMRLGTDVAALLMRGVSAGVQTVAANPVRADRAVTAFGKTMRDAINPAARERMLRSERYQWWTGRGLEGMTPNDLRALDRPDNGLLMERFWEAGPGAVGERLAGTPGRWVGEGPVSLEKWQFGVLMPTMKYHAAEALFNTLRPMKAFAGMTDDQLAAQIATRVNTILSGVSRLRAGVSPDMEWLNRQALLSPNWTRGQVANLTDVTKGGAEGLLARRFWVGLSVMGLGASAALSVAVTRDASVTHIEQLLDPRNPDSITNPRSPNFMRVETPDGGHINLWGPLATISRSILRPVAAGIGEGAERWDERAPSEPIYQTIAAVAKEAAGSTADWGNTEPWRQWVEDRKGIHIGLIQDLRANQDRMGHTISTADSGSWERVADAMKYVAGSSTPAVTDVLLNRRDSAIPQFDPGGAGTMQGVAGFFGADYNPGPDTPAPIAQKVSAFLDQNGIHPGPDPLRTYGRALREGQIPTPVAERFKAQNPDIAQYQAAQQDKRQQQQRPAGDEAVSKYTEMRFDLGQQRDTALQAAAQQYAATHDGNAYRQAVEKAWTGYQFALSGAAQKYFGTANITTAQELVDQKKGRTSRADAVDRAADEYELMRVPDGATPDQRDAMLEARRQFLAPGGAADERYGPGTGSTLMEVLRNRYVQRGGETYGLYFDAQQTMGQYAAISPYIGMDARTARRAGAAIDRARALHQYGLSPSPLLAVLQDTEIDDDTRLAAMRIIKFGKRMVNPERMAFRWQNLKMLTFYGDLNNEDFARLTGAA